MFLRKIIKQFNLQLLEIIDGNYYLKNEEMFVCLISPHEGTNYQYMLRADSIKGHDRWANCDFESFINENTMDEVLLDLEKYCLRLDL